MYATHWANNSYAEGCTTLDVDDIVERDIFTVESNRIWINATIDYEIYDIAGTKVKSGSNNSIDISSLPTGIYIIKSEKGSHKFLKD